MAADNQTGGRGTRGRSFFCYDGGLYLSLFMTPKKEIFDAATAYAGVAVCLAIEKLTDKKPCIKWVNDIYRGGKKICGILCESVDLKDRKKGIIIGVGLNIVPPAGGFPPEIEKKAGAVFSNDGARPTSDIKNLMCAEIVNQIYSLCEKSRDQVLFEYRSRLFIKGREITFCQNGQTFRATAENADDRFRLVVSFPSGQKKTLQSGEVTLLEYGEQ